MNRVVTNDTLLESFLHIQRRRLDEPSPSQTSVGLDEPIGAEQWRRVIDTLLEWRHQPEQIEDDDLLPIARERLDDALRLADAMCRLGLAPPIRAIPNTEGGVSFEHWQGDVFEVIEMDAAGGVEVRAFKGDRLVARGPWEIRR